MDAGRQIPPRRCRDGRDGRADHLAGRGRGPRRRHQRGRGGGGGGTDRGDARRPRPAPPGRAGPGRSPKRPTRRPWTGDCGPSDSHPKEDDVALLAWVRDRPPPRRSIPAGRSTTVGRLAGPRPVIDGAARTAPGGRGPGGDRERGRGRRCRLGTGPRPPGGRSGAAPAPAAGDQCHRRAPPHQHGPGTPGRPEPGRLYQPRARSGPGATRRSFGPRGAVSGQDRWR